MPTHRFVKHYAKHAITRLYLYSYSAEFSLADILAATQSERVPVIVSVVWEILKRYISRKIFRYDIPHLGICHGDELQLIFNWPLSAFVGEGHRDYDMSMKMVKTWTDFVKGRYELKI